jgi:hypothetical protein
MIFWGFWVSILSLNGDGGFISILTINKINNLQCIKKETKKFIRERIIHNLLILKVVGKGCDLVD